MGLREAADHDALRALEARRVGLPDGLDVAWLGVSGYRLTYEGVSVFVDPYVSRVPLRDMIFRRSAMPDLDLIRRYARTPTTTPGPTPTPTPTPTSAPGPVAGVLVGHTHFDHAIDAPAIAREYGTKVYGSSSMTHLMGLHGLHRQAVTVEPHVPYELGPFVVRFVPSRHSKLLLGRKVPMDGELTCDHVGGLCPSAYRCGDVWGIHITVAGTTLYHQGSADLRDDQLRHGTVDVFLAGIAGRSVTPRYWERILPKLDPRIVVPTHYDDFFAPLGRPLSFVRRVALARVPDEIGAVSRDATVVALPRADQR